MRQLKEIGLSHTVELPILTNTQSKFSFGDNEVVLDDVVIHGISIPIDNITVAPSGRAILPIIELQKGFITLADAAKKEFNAQMPLEIFVRYEPIIYFKPRRISVRNSYVDFPLINAVAIPAGPPAGYAVVFTFYYDRYDPEKHDKLLGI